MVQHIDSLLVLRVHIDVFVHFCGLLEFSEVPIADGQKVLHGFLRLKAWVIVVVLDCLLDHLLALLEVLHFEVGNCKGVKGITPFRANSISELEILDGLLVQTHLLTHNCIVVDQLVGSGQVLDSTS